MDIYRMMRPDVDERDSKLVWVGRSAAAAMTLVSVGFIPCIYLLSDTIYQAMQSIIGAFSPSITVVFLCAVFWPRANGTGAFWWVAALNVP